MNDKFMKSDDSFFSINNHISNLKVQFDDTSSSLNTTRQNQEFQVERLEKLENDHILLKDEHDTRLMTSSSQISYIMENFTQKKSFNEGVAGVKTELGKTIRENEEVMNRLSLRVIELEKQMPEIAQFMVATEKNFGELTEKTNSLD